VAFFLNQNVEPLKPEIIYSDLDKPPYQSYIIALNHQSPGIDPAGLFMQHQGSGVVKIDDLHKTLLAHCFTSPGGFY
jgi:hypothetical protein